MDTQNDGLEKVTPFKKKTSEVLNKGCQKPNFHLKQISDV